VWKEKERPYREEKEIGIARNGHGIPRKQKIFR